MRRRRALVLAALAATGGVAGKRAIDHRIASWSTNPDPTGGQPLAMPEGREVEIHATDGAVLRGVDCGTGPAVLLVHGFIEDRRFWGPVARRLVDSGFRVVAVDQRGHGRSERGTAGYRPETLGRDLATWVEELDLRDTVLAGHSMGGLASMAFAVHHHEVATDRVRGLVLVATLASPPRDPRLPELEFDQSKFLGLVDRVMRHPDYGLLTLVRVFGTRPARAQMEVTRTGFLETDPVTRIDAARMMQAFDLRAGLPGISIPSVVVAGTHDQLTFLHGNEEIAELIPGCRLEVLPGLGHMLMFEAPDRLVDEIVQASKPTDA